MKLIDYINKNENIPVNIFTLEIPYYNSFTPCKRTYSGLLYNIPERLLDQEIIEENINFFTNNTNLYIY